MALKFPTIYLLSAHLDSDELHELEEKIPTLTYDIKEATVVVGKISNKERALLELRRLKLQTEEVPVAKASLSSPNGKRKATSDPEENAIHSDSTASDYGDDTGETQSQASAPSGSAVRVVRLAWFLDSVAKRTVLPLEDYLICERRKVQSTPEKYTPKKTVRKETTKSPNETLGRAAEAAASSHSQQRRHHREVALPKRPRLLTKTTSEHDVVSALPPIPDFLHTTYSCQRATTGHPPNEAFIDLLKAIRETRRLTGDKIGIRAYSSAIASLSAYPHPLQSAFEVGRLPGCGPRIAELYHEYRETGKLGEVEKTEKDTKLSVLRIFYNILFVGDHIAKELYNKGWRDLDDVVEYGWGSLTRSQQIGVKYYDEFLQKISRDEVESIAETVLQHAKKIQEFFQMVVVGGYRRGKTMSGDVDLVLSHADESATAGFIEKIVSSLENDKFITHTLTLSTANTVRGQTPVSWKGAVKAGSGFDTLDKALVVWQDPKWTPQPGETKNTNPHRRVDIIISPWKTVGCAILGWTSETTFQRDLRRYCKAEKGLKFDSSGIRSRVDGSWVDLEDGGQGRAPDMLTAERRVFDGLGLEWRPPSERCTG